MATTLFIIGNGFDINCGMKTKYIDSYKVYVKNPSKTENIDKFKTEIKEYLKETVGENTEEENINWSDFEVAMSKYLIKCKDENEFIECLRDFKAFLSEYLKNEEEKFFNTTNDRSIKEKIHEEMELSLKLFYKDINMNITNELSTSAYTSNKRFISFNYTNVFDKLISNFSQYNIFVHHINGSFEDCALGMDNFDQIVASFPLSNRIKRDFIKTAFNEEYDLRRISFAMDRIDEAKTICLFGVSLGESDISWRNNIVEWLKSSESNHLFIYRHKYAKTQYSVVAERMEIEEEAKKQIFREWNMAEDEELMNRIHIPIGKNIFNIGKIIEKTIDTKQIKGKEIVDEIIAKEEKDI